MLSKILEKLESQDLKSAYQKAYDVMRSKHSTRSPVISLIYELGLDANQTDVNDRRAVRLYLLDKGVQLRGPDRQGFDERTTRLKSEAQRINRAKETPEQRKLVVEKMVASRWLLKPSKELEEIQTRQRNTLHNTLDNRTPEEKARVSQLSIDAYNRLSPPEKVAFHQRQVAGYTKGPVTMLDGKTFIVDSSWEAGMYNNLYKLGCHFFFNSGRTLGIHLSGRKIWFPDFIVYNHAVIIEVKGHYEAERG